MWRQELSEALFVLAAGQPVGAPRMMQLYYEQIEKANLGPGQPFESAFQLASLGLK
jgi:hypothetical protein